MRSKMIATMLLALVLALAGCSLGLTEGDFLFLESNHAYLPVWVYGNTPSKTFIVVLHGGPGDNSQKFHLLPAFETLQKDFGIVLWDQRLSGNAQGTTDASTFTMDQLVTDTHAVVTIIKKKFGAERVFLLGASWGGCLGTAYLLDPARQSEISGWIEVNGFHNGVLGNQLSRDWAMTRIRQQLDQGGLTADQTTKLQTKWNFYNNDHPVLTTAEMDTHAGYINDLGGYQYDPGILNKLLETKGADMIFFSPENLLTEIFNSQNLHANIVGHPLYKGKQLMEIDLTPEMSAITVPSLVLWGAHDGILPSALAQDAYDHLGTATADKSLYIFANSGHMPFIEEPADFVNQVSTFIKKHS